MRLSAVVGWRLAKPHGTLLSESTLAHARNAASAMSHRVDAVPLSQGRTRLGARVGETPDQLGPKVVESDDVVNHQVRRQLEEVHILGVLRALLLDEGLALRLVGDGGNVVGVNGVHGRLRTHHRDLGAWQRDGGLGPESGTRHRVQPGSVRLAHDHRELGHARLRDGGDHLCSMADDAGSLDFGADHEPRHVRKEEQRDVEGVAHPDEAGGLVGGVDEENSALLGGIVGDHADNPPFQPGQAHNQLRGEEGLDLEEALLVDQAVYQIVNVVTGQRIVRDQPFQHLCRRTLAKVGGRRLAVVGGQIGEEVARHRDCLGVVLSEVVPASGNRGVHPGSAHFLQRRLLADHHLRHSR